MNGFNYSTPLVTILMPVYNGEKYLREAINSILNQTFTDFEFLIINDGSQDNTENIILSYNDTRIRYIKNEENIKLIETLNKGIDLAKGKYIARMDADDISEPNRLELQVEYMEANEKVAVCGSWFTSFGNKNGETKYASQHDDIMFNMLYQCHICHPSVIMRTSILRINKLFYNKDFLHAEDYELFTRIGLKYKLHNLPHSLLNYRVHENSITKSNQETQYSNSIIVKQHLFKKIGIDISCEDIETFSLLLYQNYKSLKGNITAIKNILELLIEKNQESCFFDNSFLKSKFSFFWFHLCYNISNYKVFLCSKILSDGYNVTFIQKIKWLLK